MKKLFEKRYMLRQNWVLVLGFCLFAYFSYHLIQGDRSYIRQIGVERKIAALKAESEELICEHALLEKKVSMLRPGNINRDLLEERARIVLGYRFDGERDLILTQ